MAYNPSDVWADPFKWPPDLWRESMLFIGREAGRDGYSIGDVQSRRKDARLAACRRRLAWELHQNRGLSTPQIGVLMRKDHSSVVMMLQRAGDGVAKEERMLHVSS